MWGTDTVGEAYPKYKFLLDNLSKWKELPMWYPDILGGMPYFHVGFPYFYPPKWIAYILSPNDPMGAFSKFPFIFHLFIGGLFMFWLLRYLKITIPSSLFGSIAYMFTGYIATAIYAGHEGKLTSYYLIPLVFYGFIRGLDSGKLIWFLISGLTAGFQILGGHIQVVFHTGLILIIYYICWLIYNITKKENRKKVIYSITGSIVLLIFVLLIGSVQLLSQLEYSKFTARSEATYEFSSSFSFPPEEIIRFVSPGFFGWLTGKDYWGRMELKFNTEYTGILIIIASIFAIFKLWKKKKEIQWLTIIALFGMLTSFGKYFILHKILFYTIPKFSYFRAPGQFLIMFVFPLAILSGIGLDLLSKTQQGEKESKSKGKKLPGIIIAFAVMIGISIIGILASGPIAKIFEDIFNAKTSPMHSDNISSSFAYTLIMLVLFGVLILLRWKNLFSEKVFFIFALLITTVEMIIVCRHYLVGMSKKQIEQIYYPKNEITKRLIADNQEQFRIIPLQDFSSLSYSYHGIQSWGGLHPVKTKVYDEFSKKTSLNDLRILSLVNTKYLISNQKIDLEFLDEITKTKDKYLYLNKYYLPRVYLADSIIVVKTNDEAFEKLRSPEFIPGKMAIVVSDDEEIKNIKWGDPVDASITKYSPNEVKIKTNSNGFSFLVLSDVYIPMWETYVKGVKAPVYNVNAIFRGVIVPDGESEVIFKFNSKAFNNGKWISLTGVLLWILTAILFRKVNFYQEKRLKAE